MIDNEDYHCTKAELSRLLKQGVLGFYTHFEVTEVIAVPEPGAPPLNVFSVLVAEDRAGRTNNLSGPPEFLGTRIKLKNMKGWSFGVCRYIRSVAQILESLDVFRADQSWSPSGTPLNVGHLVSTPSQFVPADSTITVPLNNVLKNNYWNGSYVVELADPQKNVLKPVFADPIMLQELSGEIQNLVPLRLASLSDRIGHIVFQMPVTSLVASFSNLRSKAGGISIAVGWNSKSTPRPLRVAYDIQFDGTLTGYSSLEFGGSGVTILVRDGPGMHRATLWDDENRALLGAMGSTSFIETIVTNMQVADPEPRVFNVPDGSGVERQERIEVSSTQEIVASAPKKDRGEKWSRDRVYRDEAARLARERRFVQYRPSGSKVDCHHAGLTDLHYLLQRYGKSGAWLWDPYLSAVDLLKTLFYCPHAGVELRALTGGSEPPCERTNGSQIREETFSARQRTVLASARSNWRGIRLEYRIRTGSEGWPFHDRFLIFPADGGGALAWSLGTSVNSFGTIHHILQKVDDGQMVADAFVELWDQLDQERHLIWKTA